MQVRWDDQLLGTSGNCPLIKIRAVGPELSIGFGWNLIHHLDEDGYALAKMAQHSFPHCLLIFRRYYYSRNNPCNLTTTRSIASCEI
jgi:hypothetical protein